MATEFETGNSIRSRLEKLSPEKRKILERLRTGKISPESVDDAEHPRTAPLSSAQQRLWFLEQLTPNSPFYTVDMAFRIPPPVDIDAMRRGLAEMVRRHEILRTSFVDRNGTPIQTIAPQLDLPFPVVDLRHLPEEDRDAEAMRLAVEEAKKPFDLRQPPLLRTSLIRLTDDQFLFLLNIHHIIADGWSLQIFSQELTALYEAFREGRESPLTELPIQFGDYTKWEHEFLQEGAAEQLAYWTHQLADLPILHLPTDHPRPAQPGYRGLRHFVSISQSIVRGLEVLAREERTTLYATLLTAFQILLHRYSGQDEIVVGTPVAGRTHANTEALIGCFINALVMRVDLSGDPTFREALGRVAKVVIEALGNQNVALEKLVDELKIPRDLSRNPLFQVTFQVFQAPGQLGPGTKPLIVQKGTTQMDLMLDLFHHQNGLSGTVEFSTELFEPSTIERMCGHFLVLLEGIVDNPNLRVSQLPLLTHPERRQIIEEWNATRTKYECDHWIHDLVSEQAARTPGAVAVRSSGTELTYIELETRANHLANVLRSRGVGNGALAGICLDRSPDAIIAILAILKAGGAYVSLDASYPKERLALLIEDARPVVILTNQAISNLIPAEPARLLLIDVEAEVTNPSAASQTMRVTSADPAYVVYTSGSTGTPKGVIVSHGALLNHMLAWCDSFPLVAGERMLHKYSLSFDVATLEIFAPLLSGAEIVIAPPGAQGNVDTLLDLIITEQVAAVDLIPSQLALFVDHPKFANCAKLRRITCGGEVMSAPLAKRALALGSFELYNVYGPTEATISATWWKCIGEDHWRVPIGRPIANMRAYILDKYGNPAPIGVPGELLLAGAGLASGYLNRPELTREKFVPADFDRKRGGLAYRTGDLARFLPDGNIEFLGRIDTQVKIRGYRVELGEVEATISRDPSVEACTVAAHTNDSGDLHLVAYVVPAKESELWPSLGEYSVYDPLLYYAKSHDEKRTERYRASIEKMVSGKVVAVVGTRADALLARQCVDAGARRIYAIEMLPDSYAAAKRLIAQLGVGDQIRLIHGDEVGFNLPEKVDVFISELFGTIASSEGAVPILNRARGFLKTNGTMIPIRANTRIAGVSLPENLRAAPAFTRISGPYVERIFAAMGYPFDVRLCIDHANKSWLISHSALFETLDFTREVEEQSTNTVTLPISKDGRLDGFLLWLVTEPTDGVVVDALEEFDWLPVFFPAFSPAVEVKVGDILVASCSVRIGTNSTAPDYRVHGKLLRGATRLAEFDYESPHSQPLYKRNAFYAALFADGYADRYADSAVQIGPQALKKTLSRTLPEFMMPSKFVLVPRIPLTAGGKVDRQRLSVSDRTTASLRVRRRHPRNEMERAIAGIWQELLALNDVSVDENFFDLGGHSLLVVRLQGRIRDRLNIEVAIVDLFRYSTVAALSEYLSGATAVVTGTTK